MSGDEEQEIVGRRVAELMEHFDAVQIFVTRYDAEREATRSVRLGDGNYFARYGMVREWVMQQEQDMRTGAADEGDGDEG